MDNFIRINNPPYRWLVNERFGAFFKDYLIGQEQVIYEQGRNNPLKDNNARTVFKLKLPKGKKLFIKRYKINSFNRIIKTFFCKSKAFIEFKNAVYLKKRDIDTVTPLAVLEKKSYGIVYDAFLFLEDMGEVITLKEFLAPKTLDGRISLSLKKQILSTLAQKINELQQIKFLHKDLHTGNVIIVESAKPHLYLIDLHRGRITQTLSDYWRFRNWAQMSYSLSLVLPRTDIIRFLKFCQRDLIADLFKLFATSIFKKIDRIRLRHWRSRTKRCLKASSLFSIWQNKNVRIFHGRDLTPPKILGEIAHHNKIVQCDKKALFKYTPNRLISVHTGYFIKEYRYAFIDRLKNLFRRHPAKSAWVAANAFRVRDVATAEALALVEERFGAIVKRSYLVFREIKNAVPSNEYVSKFETKKCSRSSVRDDFIRNFAQAISRLHQEGIYHSDLKANNILICDQTTYKSGKFYYLDLDRVSFKRNVSLRRRIKNLAQLNAAMPAVMTRTDRMRFFRYYCSNKISHAVRKKFIRQIMKITIKRRHFWPVQTVSP